MKIIKWIIGVLFALGVVVIAAGFVFMKFMGAATTPNEFTENVPKVMRTSLDTPFLFILDIKELSSEYMAKDSDVFSTWGYVVLRNIHNDSKNTNALIKEITRVAKNYQWKSGYSNPDDSDLQEVLEEQIDFDTHGFKRRAPDLAFFQSAISDIEQHQGPPTRYMSRLWISEDNNSIIMSFRVDSE